MRHPNSYRKMEASKRKGEVVEVLGRRGEEGELNYRGRLAILGDLDTV